MGLFKRLLTSATNTAKAPAVRAWASLRTNTGNALGIFRDVKRAGIARGNAVVGVFKNPYSN